MTERKLRRRDFLRLSATATVGMLAAACALPTAGVGEEEAQVVEKEPTLIRVHHRLGGECDNWEYWAQKFNDEHSPDIDVKMECSPGADYFKKLNVMAAGGTIGDIVWISSIEGFYRMAATGVFAPLDDLVADTGFDLGGIYELAVEAAKHEGKLYGLPQLSHPGRTGLFYDMTLFDAAGIDYPDDTWTYDDLLAAAQQLTNPDEGVFGMDPTNGYFGILVDLRAWGGDVINEDGTKCPINSPEAVAALKFRSDLYHTHKVAALPGQVLEGTTQMVAANKLAMFQTGFWGWSTRNFLERPDTLGVAPMPKGTTGHMGSMFESDPACLTTNSKHKQEAFEFMGIFTTFDYQFRAWQEHGHMSCRPDVMNNEEVLQDPMMKVFAGIFAQAMPLVLPANFRETEYFKTITEEFSVIWLGQKTVDEVIDDIQKKAQDILDKSSLEVA